MLLTLVCVFVFVFVHVCAYVCVFVWLSICMAGGVGVVLGGWVGGRGRGAGFGGGVEADFNYISLVTVFPSVHARTMFRVPSTLTLSHRALHSMARPLMPAEAR